MYVATPNPPHTNPRVLTEHKAPECIDFTDNDIAHLGGFPLFPQLKNLMAARNRISTIQSDLAKNVPNLFNLVLTENNVTELADLDPLQGFTRLQHLALMDNPVTSKEVYFFPGQRSSIPERSRSVIRTSATTSST